MDLRSECQRCRRALPPSSAAYICADECTYCPTCYRALAGTCPTYGGELVRRPRRGSRGLPPDEGARPRASTEVAVRRAGVDDVLAIAPLFDAYRQFYEQPPDLEAASAFLTSRLAVEQSVVLVAELRDEAIGFVQLYPMFSSVSLRSMYVLNDLFVEPDHRQKGIGKRLLEEARRVARELGADSLELTTAVDNPAQRLYEADGWILDTGFLHYDFRATDD